MKTSALILQKLKQLTTPLGIYQFGKGNQPDPSLDYALDDQARALIVTNEFKEKKLKTIYLQHILRSQRPDGLLYQFSDKDGKFVDNSSEEATFACQDAYGETLLALFKTGAYKQKPVKPIVKKLTNYAKTWKLPRPMASALIGLTTLKPPSFLEKTFTTNLIKMFNENSSLNWQWFEKTLTYANAILPWSLWEVALKRNNKKAGEIAKKTTDFLIDTCQINEIPSPIGSNGWYPKGGNKAIYDQQPIDPAYMVCCLERAYKATNEKKYINWAKKWWGWFWGENINGIPLVDKHFGCFDGLTPQGVNKNQGAESNICFLFAYLSAQRLRL